AASDATWEWNGIDWKRRTPRKAYRATGKALAYDSVRGFTIEYAGRPGTLLWDGKDWSAVPGPLERDPSRYAIDFDPVRGRAVLFGGSSKGAALDVTCEFDGRGWSVLSLEKRPGARWDASMSYDAARGRMVLFGGRDRSGVLGDTWEMESPRVGVFGA